MIISKAYLLLSINFAITQGNAHDITQAESAKAVILARKNCKDNREYDKEVYKNRNQIERFFNKIKQYRRISARYDKLVISFLSFIQIASILIVLPKFPSIV